MRKPALSNLSARLSSRKSKSSRQDDVRLSSNVEAKCFLLATYETEDVIAQAVKSLENFKHASGLRLTVFDKKWYTSALRFGMVSQQKRVKSLFVKKLAEVVCDNFLLY